MRLRCREEEESYNIFMLLKEYYHRSSQTAWPSQEMYCVRLALHFQTFDRLGRKSKRQFRQLARTADVLSVAVSHKPGRIIYK